MNEQNIVYFARLSRIIFFWPIVLIAAMIYVFFAFPDFETPSLIFIGISALWLLMTWVTYYFSSLTLKKNQVILSTGLLVRKTVDIPLSKIESIDIRQSIIGSIFRYGSLEITGTGGTRNLISFICRPLSCRREIEQLMYKE